MNIFINTKLGGFNLKQRAKPNRIAHASLGKVCSKHFRFNTFGFGAGSAQKWKLQRIERRRRRRRTLYHVAEVVRDLWEKLSAIQKKIRQNIITLNDKFGPP